MFTAYLLTLLACPEPIDAAAPPGPGGDPSQAGGAPPPIDGAAPPPDGSAPVGAGAPPAGDGTVPAAGSAPPPPTAGVKPPSLSELVAGGATAKLTVKLEGATDATIDFVEEGPDGGPSILAQEKLSGASGELAVPASYGKEVWLSAWTDAAGDGPDPADPKGFYEKPVKFDGKDLTVTIKLAKNAAVPTAGPLSKPPGAPPGGAAPGQPPAGGAAPGAVPGGAPGGAAPPPTGNP